MQVQANAKKFGCNKWAALLGKHGEDSTRPFRCKSWLRRRSRRQRAPVRPSHFWNIRDDQRSFAGLTPEIPSGEGPRNMPRDFRCRKKQKIGCASTLLSVVRPQAAEREEHCRVR